MNRWLLGLRLLGRDWRGGELGLLLAALLLSVSIVVAIGLFVERIQTAILAESSQFLAADRLLRSGQPLPDDWPQLAEQDGLRHAQVVNFPTMAYVGEELQLSAVKAVDSAYPLLGTLDIRRMNQPVVEQVASGPDAGEVWVAPRLLELLGTKLGGHLFIGEAELRITALIMREPDAGFSVFAYGPRVLMSAADLAAANVIQPGSRVQYNLLVQGDPADLQRWQDGMQEKLGPEQQLIGVRDSQPRLARSIDRAERFLLLAGAMGVVLAGVAIAISSRRYTERHYDFVGILKSLGSSSGTIMGFYTGHLLLLCLLAIVLGSAAGWVFHSIAIESIRELLLVELPPPGLSSIVLGAVTALVSFFAFAFPALLHLQQVAPMRVLRRDLGTPSFNSRLVFYLGLLGLLLLIYLYSGSLMITVALMLGLGSVALLVIILTVFLLRSARAPGAQATRPLGLAVAGIRRRARHSALQVFVFTVVLLLVLTMLLARNSLVAEWRLQIPEQTPNHFLVNISPDNVAALEELLASSGYQHAGLYPMVRVNMMAHNGSPPERVERALDGGRQQESGERSTGQGDDRRQINITWTAEMPEDNVLQQGRWWTPGELGLVSLEAEFAQRYGIQLGDTLTFSLLDRQAELTVSSIRELDWEQMRPNFFAIASPGSLPGFDAVYMTSFYLPDGEKAFLNELIRAVPTLSIIEMDRMIDQFKRIIDQVSMAIELVLGLIMLSAALVLFASIQSSMDERYQENAILKTLGARLSLLRRTMLLEFCILGALAGLLAAIGAEILIALVQTRLLELDYKPHFWVFAVGPLAGAVLVALLGNLIGRKSLNSPPARVLRELP